MIRDTTGQDRVLHQARPQARWRRWLLPSAVALAVLALAAFAVRGWVGGSQSVSADRLRIAEASRGAFVRDAAVDGRVVAAVSPTLYTPVDATVTLKVQAGAQVHKGQVLVELDSPELANELQREQSTLQQMEAEAGSAQISAQQLRLQSQRETDEAEIGMQVAERELQRARRAHDAGVLAEVEYLKAKDALESARLRRDNAASGARLAGRSGGYDVETKRQQLQRQRLLVADLQRRVDVLKVASPVEGIVGTGAVADRANIPSNAPLLTVVDLSRLEVELTVPESYADDLGLGMPVQVTLGGGTVAGRLSAISPEVVSNEVLVRVAFDGKQPPGLRQNQRVSARIVIDERADVLRVARGPFLEQGGGTVAYVMEGDTAVRRAIRTGAHSVGQVEIIEGVAPGERVVIAGADTFGNAERVRVSR